MKLLDLKIRMMLLWIWIPVAMTAGVFSVVFRPGGLEEIVSNMQTMGIWASVSGVLVFLGPLVMAFLSLTLKDRANCITNRVLSIIYAALMLFQLVNIFISEPTILGIMHEGSTVVAAAYLIFYSWKWPVKEA